MLRNVTLSDGGWYTCLVSNMYGQIRHSAWIEILDLKPLGQTQTPNVLFMAVIIALGLFVAAVVVLTAICWQRRRPPKTRALVLKENSIYFPCLDIPVDPQWEINRIQ